MATTRNTSTPDPEPIPEPVPDPQPEQDMAARLAEMEAAFARLERQHRKLQEQMGVGPVTEAVPDQPTHGLTLGCGDSFLEAINPVSTHHHCDVHGLVPVTGVFNLHQDYDPDAEAQRREDVLADA